MQSLPEEACRFLWVVAQRVVPESVDLDEDCRQYFETIVDRALLDRPASVRRQFVVFLKLVRLMTVFRFGSVFDRLQPDRQDRVLSWLEDCPVMKLRQGFWGLKSLIFMGYYGQPGNWQEVGYAPEFDSRVALSA
ncbi:MAG: hypothetical protein GY906_27895 [bacterium]|nr:hypothetical protein [bacterium]